MNNSYLEVTAVDRNKIPITTLTDKARFNAQVAKPLPRRDLGNGVEEITITDCEPNVLRTFLSWISSGGLTLGLIQDHAVIALTKLWLLGNDLEAQDFKKAVLNLFWMIYYPENGQPPFSQHRLDSVIACYVFEETEAILDDDNENPLREIMIHILLRGWNQIEHENVDVSNRFGWITLCEDYPCIWKDLVISLHSHPEERSIDREQRNILLNW